MASLRIRNNQYESRIFIWNGYRQAEKTIPLRTSSKVVALTRHQEVKSLEKDIKKGIEFNFSWMTQRNANTRVIIKGIKEVSKEYISQLHQRNISSKTIDSYTLAIDYFIKSLRNIQPSEITINSIDKYKKWLKNKTKNKSPNSINIYLKSIRTFLNWCYDREYIVKVPKIELERIDKDQVKYFTEKEYYQIISYNSYKDNRFPMMYKLYWETGLRLEEGFRGSISFDRLENSWLDIPKEANKCRKMKSIMLNQEQVSTIKLIQAVWREKGSTRDHMKYYSKVLKHVIRELNIDDSKHFHSLRHSYGIRRIIELNGNIAQLRDEMGHSSVKTTEIYSKGNPKRILLDFPSLNEQITSNNHRPKYRITGSKSTGSSNNYNQYSLRGVVR